MPLKQNSGPWIAGFVIVILALAGLAFTATHPSTAAASTAPASSQAWEYRIETPVDANFIARMNQLGQEGWEIVSLRRVETDAETYVKTNDRMQYEVVLKRRATPKP